MPDDTDDNVIQLFPRVVLQDPEDERAPLTVMKRWESGCQHDASIVDETLRQVRCRDCGAELDPIEVLIDLSKVYQHRDYRLSALMRAEKRLSERALETLKRARVRHKKHDFAMSAQGEEEPKRTCWKCEQMDRDEKHHLEMLEIVARYQAKAGDNNVVGE